MGDIPTGPGDNQDAERGLSGGSGSGSGVDFACPFCGATCEHYRGYGFAGGTLGAYTYCGNDACEKLIELAPDLEGLSDEEAAKIMARVEEWRKGLQVSESDALDT